MFTGHGTIVKVVTTACERRLTGRSDGYSQRNDNHDDALERSNGQIRKG